MTLAPMWKCTGSSSSAQTSQNGSQARLARSGAPRSCGSDVMFTPRAPSAGDPLGLAHAGVDVPRRHERHREQPVARVGLDLGHAVVVDLDGQPAAAPGRRPCPRSWPPRPMVLGKMTCASMPHSSSTSRRTFGSYAPDVDLVVGPLDERPMLRLFLHAVAADDAAGAEAAHRVAVEHPHLLPVDAPRPAGPGPLIAAGARLVKRSWRFGTSASRRRR